MSLQDELTAAQRCLDELVRTVARLERDVGGGLEIRRVRSDADHLRESLSLLRASVPRQPADAPPGEIVIVPDTPYDRALWADAEEEGLGAPRDRPARDR
ncbi:hypothetical protein V1L54_07380 [Streptomyces sp. TRM 70361]|uniref:hypothetical protein n=1 Tax=Streptomyces sp. TRM 70361 TaxID=3116553 RepID=UPI002E7AE285|nr:hypothetical protein [Streptomyces sp. TRM 70361]MEE1939235.1 hypothetical protein [Streptomyces sp. TRM 70361]